MNQTKQTSTDSDLKKQDQSNASKIIFWIAIVVAFFFFIRSFGTGWWHILFIIAMWGVFIYFLRQWAFGKRVINTWFAVAICVIVFFLSMVIVFGGSNSKAKLSQNNTNSEKNIAKSSESDKCKAVQLKEKPNERVEVKIVANEDIQQDHTKNNYTLKELKGLQYGGVIHEVTDGVYMVHELCAGDRSLSFADLDAEEWNFYQDQSGAVTSVAGNYYQFVNENADGKSSSLIQKPGTYTVYAYASTDGKNWSIAGKHTFTVTE